MAEALSPRILEIKCFQMQINGHNVDLIAKVLNDDVSGSVKRGCQ